MSSHGPELPKGRAVFVRGFPAVFCAAQSQGSTVLSLSMGLREVRGHDEPHAADSSPLLHSVSRADPEQSPLQQVPSTW